MANEREWGKERRGGARAGAGWPKGKRKLETAPVPLRLPLDVIEAATARALELSRVEARKVSRQEVYRRLIDGSLPPLQVDGSGPWKSETLHLTEEQTGRLDLVAARPDMNRSRAADFLLRNAYL
jgi:hypothetical protein